MWWYMFICVQRLIKHLSIGLLCFMFYIRLSYIITWVEIWGGSIVWLISSKGRRLPQLLRPSFSSFFSSFLLVLPSLWGHQSHVEFFVSRQLFSHVVTPDLDRQLRSISGKLILHSTSCPPCDVAELGHHVLHSAHLYCSLIRLPDNLSWPTQHSSIALSTILWFFRDK